MKICSVIYVTETGFDKFYVPQIANLLKKNYNYIFFF